MCVSMLASTRFKVPFPCTLSPIVQQPSVPCPPDGAADLFSFYRWIFLSSKGSCSLPASLDSCSKSFLPSSAEPMVLFAEAIQKNSRRYQTGGCSFLFAFVFESSRLIGKRQLRKRLCGDLLVLRMIFSVGKVTLKNQHRGHRIHDVLAFFSAHIGRVQNSDCRNGGAPLIPKHNRNPGPFLKEAGKLRHQTAALSSCAVHIQRVASAFREYMRTSSGRRR